MVIGIVSIAFGLYGIFKGKTFEDYFFSLFIGITLFGIGYINAKEWKNKELV